MGLSRLAQHPGDRFAFLRLNQVRTAFWVRALIKGFFTRI
jgi:hypothetical protein